MIHTWHCNKCNATYETACYQWEMYNGVMVLSHTLLSHRKQVYYAGLCGSCFAEMEKNLNPILELLTKLEEKKRELGEICSSLKKAFEDNLEKTPERLKALKVQEENTKKFRKEIFGEDYVN